MRVVKSVITGLVTAILALLGWVVVSILFGLRFVASTGAGGLGAVSSPIPGLGGLIAMTVGFAGGFYWMWKRASKRVTPS